MYTTFDIFKIFKEQKAKYLGKGYRLPKDWNDYFKNKLSPQDQRTLTDMTNKFNTVYCSIIPEKYFEIGSMSFNNFTINNFLNEKIIEKYITLDKIKKQKKTSNKSDYIDSIRFIANKLNMTDDIVENILIEYCKSDILQDYMLNNISVAFLVWMIYDRYIVIPVDKIGYITFIQDNFHVFAKNLMKNRKFLCKLKTRKYNDIN